MGTGSGDTPTDADETPTLHAAHKPGWRRALEMIVPVAVFAVVAPFAVNGLASAINSAAADPEHAAESVVETATTTTTSLNPVIDTTVPVTIAGVDAGADDQTIALATEIVNATATADTPATPEASTTAADPDAEHAHGGVTPELALTRSERAELGDQLAQARSGAMRYPTVAEALAGGYVKVVGYVPLIGSHYIKWSSMDATFDVDDPEMLLYDGTEPTSHIVGLSYYLFSDTEPTPFAGPNDHWHQHIGLCIKDGAVVGGEQLSADDCAARGGTKASAGNGWMVHAWVVPGWDSPQGVFSSEHIGLTPELPTS